MSAHLDAAVRDLATAVTQPEREAGAQRVSVVPGTIATITTGGGTDGHDSVTVTISADEVPAPYLAGYTPTVGDVVRVLLVDGSPLILGKPIGLPII